jgi:hypothetical protein
VADGNGQGHRNDQLNWPANVIVDKQTDSLIICDRRNRRVVPGSCRNGPSGETILSNVACHDLIMDNDRSWYVSDYDKDEVRRWKMGEKDGTIVAGGNRLNQLDSPYNNFVDDDHPVYVSDCGNDRVMK